MRLEEEQRSEGGIIYDGKEWKEREGEKVEDRGGLRRREIGE